MIWPKFKSWPLCFGDFCCVQKKTPEVGSLPGSVLPETATSWSCPPPRRSIQQRSNIHKVPERYQDLSTVHPGRLTWKIIMEVWKIIFLSKRVICRFHVNLPGCIGFDIWKNVEIEVFQQNVWKRFPRSSNCTTLWNWSREIFDTSLVADRKKDRIISIHVTFFRLCSEAITTKRATRRHQLCVVILWVQELQKCQSSEHFPPWFQTQSLCGHSQTTTVTTGTSYRKCYANPSNNDMIYLFLG